MAPRGRADTGGREPSSPGKPAACPPKKKRVRESSENAKSVPSKHNTLSEKSLSPSTAKKKKTVDSNAKQPRASPSLSPSSESASTLPVASLAVGESSSPRPRLNPVAARPTKKRPREETEAPGVLPVDEKIGGHVSSALLRRALSGLTGYVMKKSREQETQNLLQEAGASTVSVMLALKNIPETFRIKPVQIVLPHALLDMTGGGGEVCLFVRDPQRKWKDLLAKERLPLITRVIGISKVKKKFPTFQDKRVLCAAYDMFLCDRRVFDKLTPLLGRPFIQTKKLPLPVKVSADNIRPALEEALRSTYFFLPRGPCAAIKIGRANMPVDHLFENAKTALNAAFDFFAADPKFRNEIHAVSIQATNTPALPLYTHASYAQAAQHYMSTKPPVTKMGKPGRPKEASSTAGAVTSDEADKVTTKPENGRDARKPRAVSVQQGKKGDITAGKNGVVSKKTSKMTNETAKKEGGTGAKKKGRSEKLNGKVTEGDRPNGDISEKKSAKGMNKAKKADPAMNKQQEPGASGVGKEAKTRPLVTALRKETNKKALAGATKGSTPMKKRKIEKA